MRPDSSDHAGGMAGRPATKRKSAEAVQKQAKRQKAAEDNQKAEQERILALQEQSKGYWCDQSGCCRFFRYV